MNAPGVYGIIGADEGVPPVCFCGGGIDVEKLRKFFREIKIEWKKIHWPSKEELWGATGVVVIILVVTGIYFALLDLGFSSFFKFLFSSLGIGK